LRSPRSTPPGRAIYSLGQPGSLAKGIAWAGSLCVSQPTRVGRKCQVSMCPGGIRPSSTPLLRITQHHTYCAHIPHRASRARIILVVISSLFPFKQASTPDAKMPSERHADVRGLSASGGFGKGNRSKWKSSASVG
jgi:hypothetical protein